MPGLRIAVDLNGIDLRRPRGPARHARRLAEEIASAAAGHHLEVWEPGAAGGPVDVVLALGGQPRFRGRTPVVAAVYDLSHLVAPSTLSPAERARRGFRLAWLTRRAAHLLAPSRGIAFGLANYLRVPRARLTWLPNVGPGWARPPRAGVEAERTQSGLSVPYLLFVGTISRRKNLATLLAAWERTRSVLGEQVELVMCGAGDLPSTPPGVRHLGYVPDDRLLRLVAGATAWVSPSLAEGSAMGALEAMAAGAPPIVAAGTALAEVVGTAGIVVAAEDVEGWAAALREVAVDREGRNRMAARGLQAVRDLRAADAAARCLAAAEAAAARG